VKQGLSGAFAPVTTPFDPDSGNLNRPGLEKNVRAHIAAGLSGVVVAGSTGEGALLDERERALLVDWTRPLVPGDRWLIAGTGGESTRLTIERSRYAAQRGADAVLVVAPHYYGASAMTDAALDNHFRRVADGSQVPVILYNIPKYAHLKLSAELVAALATHGNVIGIKDSSGDLGLLEAYIAGAQGPEFSVLTGNGGQMLDAVERGARGAILAVSVFTGDLVPETLAAALKGSSDSAKEGQERLTPLAREIVGGLGPAGVKAALDLVGLEGGLVREPLLPLDGPARDRVAVLLETAGLLSA
jgi:4-hydroxy-2-oxoglutarate aldolase